MYPMSNPSPLADLLLPVFLPSQRGVIGLVDDLLKACPDRGLRLDWHDGQCRIRSIGPAPDEAIEVPLPKSVFRAALARLAALCNEHIPDSVSPYGGRGEFRIGTDPPLTYTVAFTNTPAVQSVQLTRDANHGENGSSSSPAIGAWEGAPGQDGPPGRVEVRSIG
jgi:hypothetical protein